MYDADYDGIITLQEYKNVTYGGSGGLPAAALPTAAPAAPQVLDELMSGNPHLEKESLRAIAEGAMLEAASACMARTVRVHTGVAQRGWKGRDEAVGAAVMVCLLLCAGPG